MEHPKIDNNFKDLDKWLESQNIKLTESKKDVIKLDVPLPKINNSKRNVKKSMFSKMKDLKCSSVNEFNKISQNSLGN